MRASLTELKAICTKQTPSERSRGPEPPSRRLETPRSARIRTASAPRPVRVLLGSSRPSPELPCSWPSSGTSCFPSCERSGQSGSPSARSAPAPGEQEEPAPRRGVRVPLSRGCSHDLDAGRTPDGCPYRTRAVALPEASRATVAPQPNRIEGGYKHLESGSPTTPNTSICRQISRKARGSARYRTGQDRLAPVGRSSNGRANRARERARRWSIQHVR
jgi:hypothetical protein